MSDHDVAVLPGSVSLRLYPHLDLDAPAIVDELRAQAALAVAHGFDGVMTSEHHGGFAGYLPNPLQAAGWMLEAMPRGWAAACPLLITLRPPALVVEEVAWLAARFPGRVAVGLAAGALAADFEIMDTTMAGLTARFEADLVRVSELLAGRGDPAAGSLASGPSLAGDPAVARGRLHPVPVLSAASSQTAARRAARCGVGIIVDSLSTAARARALVDAYRRAGGTGPCVLVRRAWVGRPPVDRIDGQVEVYRGYASGTAMSGWGADELVGAEDAAAVADRLVEVLDGSGADALNLRVHAPGIAPKAVREQIRVLGDEVAPRVRAAVGWPGRGAHR
jgi:alkanesulfonate monooxygenase SsuD/methylene tetrahydromethanopterin reductase-like flavin-dependent oxidoreductase (luciferase family)